MRLPVKFIAMIVTFSASLGFLYTGLAEAADTATAAAADTATFNYGDYAEVLKSYVNDQGMVNYKGLKKSRKKLDSFIRDLGKLSKKTYKGWNKKERIASAKPFFLSNST